MKPEKMQEIITEELNHIPEGPKGSHQNMLRAAYQNIRENSLSKNPEAPCREDLDKAINMVDDPKGKYQFDREFFYGEK